MSDNEKALIPAVGYIRVSSEEQSEGWSLDGQEKAIRVHAERHGYEITAIFTDDSTGSKDKRPGLEKMMIQASNGQFKAIIVVHTSRLFRNIALARKYKDQLRNKLEIELLFINQPQMDPGGPDAFLMEGINELFDEYYLYQLKFWTSLGKRSRAENGMWNGTLNFGYVTDEETKIPIFHPKNKDGLILAYESYATGQCSDRDVAEILNREGYRTTGNWGERKFTKDTVNRMLQNVFYLGYVKYKGEIYPGKHPALISQELFDKCQAVRARRRNQSRAVGKRRHIYVLASLARCKDCKLTLRCGATGSGKKTRYYRHFAKQRGYDCVVRDKGVRAEELEAAWSEIVSAIKLPEDWRKRVEELVSDVDERETVLKERLVITEKIKRLKRMYQDLIVEDDEYQTTLKDLQTRLSGLVLPSNPQLIQAGEYLENLGKLWEQATMQEKMDLSRVLVKTVFINVEDGAITSIEPHPVFRMLFEEVCENLPIDIV
ncbi:recombinase family protein [Chloroflexota bacterium]